MRGGTGGGVSAAAQRRRAPTDAGRTGTGSSSSGQVAPPAGFSLGGGTASGNITNNAQGAGRPGGRRHVRRQRQPHRGARLRQGQRRRHDRRLLPAGRVGHDHPVRRDVAALGGFSGRESEVSATWLAQAVKDGRIRYVLTDASGGGWATTAASAPAR